MKIFKADVEFMRSICVVGGMLRASGSLTEAQSILLSGEQHHSQQAMYHPSLALKPEVVRTASDLW